MQNGACCGAAHGAQDTMGGRGIASQAHQSFLVLRIQSNKLATDDLVCDWRPQTNGAMALMMD